MNKILTRMIIVKEEKEYNVLLDDSFSLNDNLKLLETIIDEDLSDCYIYDKKLNVFLDKNIIINQYNIPYSTTFYIY